MGAGDADADETPRLARRTSADIALRVEKWDVRAARRRVAVLILVPAIVALSLALLIFEAVQPGNWF
jgi:hypothetical protein